MSMQDPIADMLTRIRNAQMAGHRSVVAPSSGLKMEIARVLREEGYIADFGLEGSDEHKQLLRIGLRYHRKLPVIREIKRISRPGLRVYRGHAGLPRVRGGLGIAVISTSKGVLCDSKARAQGVGGEILCTVF